MSDGRAVVGSQSDAGLHYVYDGECECPDSDRPEIGGWCKHRIAVAITKRANVLARERIQEALKSEPSIRRHKPFPSQKPREHSVILTLAASGADNA